MSEVKPQMVWLPDGFGGGEHVHVYRASDYDALTGRYECNTAIMRARTKALDRVTAERDAALAELAALKGGREAVGGDLSACPIAYAVKGSDVMFGTAYEAYQYMGEGSEPFALYTAPPAQASAWVQDSDIRSAAARAYGFLWHVNNEPGTPSPMYSAEKAAYRARIALRDMLTTEERGKAINAVGIEIGRYEQPAAPTTGASDGKGVKP